MKALDLKHIFHKELDAIYGKDEVDSFFYLCIQHYLDVPRFQLTLEPEFTLSNSETDAFFNALEDLNKQIPIQYILGETEFYGLSFKVNENVLIPRPETEELVALVLQNIKNQKLNSKKIKVIDIGTGSGCIAISLAKNLINAEVYALDVSKEALEVAKMNAELNNVELTFIEADILVEFTWDMNFDIIVSNPPYVRHLEKVEIQPNVLDNEPHLALFVDNKNPLLFYKTITNFSVNNLKQNGELYFEINQYLGEETKQLLVDADFADIELFKDLNGNDRMLKGKKNK
ncbi:peptide chain release factor N(5)-glutamine methyltransferase [Winogradskyella sp. PG-2]|uniref:peptide chain release factor N(5)-glutamine methyltransferase n=1 Tax=Winogradskyella sp. PG-2 TaxID=754409 RepID=UPI00045877D4|nr:peptide chain release factor N(5)-glutamine methyltransferase [Winogradskyella sp. PG-2]BAO77749.1 methylase of polypeptide chain release factors [Winogradskyella sp. PG-2]